ncbi:MAG: DUF4352 domain-containing protein [Verrucomicrobia bacterium]|nr:DUF4352 domain-containing protein [Verrucomicrobiota bacterium]
MLPAPSEQPATPKPRRRWRTELGFFVFFVLAGVEIFGLGAPKTWYPSLTVASPSPTPVTPAAPAASSDQDRVYSVGSPFRLGDYTYTITGCSTTDAVGGASYQLRASPGTRYVVVTFRIRNDAQRSRLALAEDFQLEDANGSTYRSSPEGTAALSAADTDSKDVFNEVRPGATQALATAFEVPLSALKGPMKVIVLEQKLFAGAKATVNLPL